MVKSLGTDDICSYRESPSLLENQGTNKKGNKVNLDWELYVLDKSLSYSGSNLDREYFDYGLGNNLIYQDLFKKFNQSGILNFHHCIKKQIKKGIK